MELEYRFATADDIENLMQARLDMLRVVNDLGPDYVTTVILCGQAGITS